MSANAPVSNSIVDRQAPMSGDDSVAVSGVQAIESDKSVNTAGNMKPRHDRPLAAH
jgi:hypothetical protein